MSRQHNLSLLTSVGQENVTKAVVVRPDSGLSDTISVYLDGSRLTM